MVEKKEVGPTPRPSWMAAAQPLGLQQAGDQLKGKFILVHYDIPGDSTWHCRLLLSHVTGGEWVILTPDGDIYTEDISASGGDIDAWRPFTPGGPVPIGVGGNHMHLFNPVPDQPTIARLLQEGEVYGAHERLQRGLLLPMAPQPVAQPAQVVPAPPAPAIGGGGGGVANLAGEAGGVDHPGGQLHQIANINGGQPIEVDGGVDGQEDARTLSITRDSQGHRFKEFRAASLECKEVAFTDWPVPGPRTILHVLSRIVEHGGSPIAHSQAWRTACKFQPSDKPAQDHEMLCRILQTMVVYDQLDVENIASAELVVRGIQRIEEQHKLKLTSVDDAGESALFLGTSGGSRGGTVVSPKLAEWIGSEMQKEAAIAKERRKAREERALSRKNEKKEDK